MGLLVEPTSLKYLPTELMTSTCVCIYVVWIYIMLRIHIAAYRADDQSSTNLSESCESSTLGLPAVSRWSRNPSKHCLQRCSVLYNVLLEPTVNVLCCMKWVATWTAFSILLDLLYLYEALPHSLFTAICSTAFQHAYVRVASLLHMYVC